MSNVVNFQKAQRVRERAVHQPAEAGRDKTREKASDKAMELVSRVTGLRSKAKEEIRHSILMLDLASRHAREIAGRLTDPAIRENFEARIENIERLIRDARAMAVAL